MILYCIIFWYTRRSWFAEWNELQILITWQTGTKRFLATAAKNQHPHFPQYLVWTVGNAHAQVVWFQFQPRRGCLHDQELYEPLWSSDRPLLLIALKSKNRNYAERVFVSEDNIWKVVGLISCLYYTKSKRYFIFYSVLSLNYTIL